MSWHMHTCGTKAEVTAAIDEAMAAQSGMPRAVGDYLKDAVANVDLIEGSPDGADRYYVVVESTGHRPMMGSSSQEKCRITKVRRGPWNLKT
jgi:hypothetical protein